jgi:hypothetical protein
MKQQLYFNYIEEKLATLATRINNRGKLNILDVHLYSENFYRDFLNKIFCWNLENLNDKIQNVEAIDLICNSNKIVIQVSATCSKAKIESALNKDSLKELKHYQFKFVAISQNADTLRKKKFTNPYGIQFNPLEDIFDITSILKKIKSLQISEFQDVYNFIKDQLGDEVDVVKLDTNLATIINILSRENLNQNDQPITVDSFEIDRKIILNKLELSKKVIYDYTIYHNRIDKKYEEFDAAGVNVSTSVLNAIRMEYVRNLKNKSDDELFFLIIDNTKDRILESKNFVPIPIDELDLCVSILVVDAFIRCKIFENPENYKYALAR